MTPTTIAEGQVSGGSDRIRLDDPAGGSLNHRMQEACQFGASWGSHIAMPNPTTSSRSASMGVGAPVAAAAGSLPTERLL